MQLETAIRLRRSVRKYAERKVSRTTVRKLLDLARRAPSSLGGEPWHFLEIRDLALKRELGTIKNKHCPPAKRAFRADFLASVPVIVLVCVDRRRSHGRILENGLLATGHLLLAARAEGLGSVYMSAQTAERPRLRTDIKRLLRIPPGIEPISLIPLGYPAERPAPKRLRPLDTMVHRDYF